MALGTWWRGDVLPELSPLPSFHIQVVGNNGLNALLMKMNELDEQEMNTRMRSGNYAYIAFLDEIAVAYGWIATQTAGVAAIQLSFTLPPNNCYLWDFQTLPTWRGRGVYPHFLQAIVRQEKFERFWILYKPGELAAEKSIRRAGFQFLGELELVEGRFSGVTLFEASKRSETGKDILMSN